MRILLVHQYFLDKNGSGGSRWNELVRFWSEKGAEITVIAGMTHYITGQKNTKHKGRYFATEKLDDRTTILWSHVSER